MNDSQERILELVQEIEAKRQEILDLTLARPPMTVTDYEFLDGAGNPVKLSDLFGDKDEMILYHNMGPKCHYCMLWADGMNGFTPHFEDRAAFVVTMPTPPAEMTAYAESRGWKFKCVSVLGTSVLHDLGFEPVVGEGTWPGFTTLSKNSDGTISRHSSSFFGPGDDFCAVWHMFRHLPKGVNDWEPKRSY